VSAHRSTQNLNLGSPHSLLAVSCRFPFLERENHNLIKTHGNWHFGKLILDFFVLKQKSWLELFHFRVSAKKYRKKFSGKSRKDRVRGILQSVLSVGFRDHIGEPYNCKPHLCVVPFLPTRSHWRTLQLSGAWDGRTCPSRSSVSAPAASAVQRRPVPRPMTTARSSLII
jgi:hypothetical protein